MNSLTQYDHFHFHTPVHDNKHYTISLMSCDCPEGSKEKLDIRIFLKTQDEEYQESCDREINTHRDNFLFNVHFKENNYQELSPTRYSIPTCDEISYFNEYLKTNPDEGFYEDGILLFESRFLKDGSVMLNFIKEISSDSVLFPKLIEKYKIEMLDDIAEVELESYQDCFERLCQIAKPQQVNTHKFEMLLLSYLLKMKKYGKFIEILSRDKETAEENIREFCENPLYSLLEEEVIYEIASIFELGMCPPAFLANLISLAKCTQIKLSLIFDKFENLFKYLPPITPDSDRINFSHILNQNDHTIHSHRAIVTKIEEKYLNDEFKIKDILDINIPELVNKFLPWCEDLNELHQMKMFLLKQAQKIINPGMHSVLLNIQLKINKAIKKKLNADDGNSYINNFCCLHKEYPNVFNDYILSQEDFKVKDLIQSFSFSDITTEFLLTFSTIKFSEMMSSDSFKEFLEAFLAKVKTWQDMLLFFNLFPFEQVKSYNEDSVKLLSNQLSLKFSLMTDKIDEKEILFDLYTEIIKYCGAKDGHLFNELFEYLLNTTKQGFPPFDFIELNCMLYLRTTNEDVIRTLYPMLETYIAAKAFRIKTRTASQLIRTILEQKNLYSNNDDIHRKKNDLCLLILNKLVEFIPDENDFYQQEMNINIKFLSELRKTGICKEPCFLDSKYGSKCWQKLHQIKQDLEEQNATIETFLTIKQFSHADFEDKIRILLMENENENEYIQFKSHIEKSIDCAWSMTHLIDHVLYFCTMYLLDIPELQQEIKKLSKLNEMKSNRILKEIYSQFESISLIHEYSQQAVQFKDLHSYAVFRKILDKENSTIDTSKSNLLDQKISNLKKSIDKFFSLEITLSQENFPKCKAKYLLDIFVNIEDTAKEIALLQKRFKAMDTNINNMLNLIRSGIHLERNISNLQAFLKCFRVIDNNIHKFEVRKDILMNLDNTIEEYNRSFTQIISNEMHCLQENEFCELIALIAGNPHLIEFLDDKNEDDIRDLTEFAEELGNAFIQASIIKDLTIVLSFLTALKKDNNINLCDKDFCKKCYHLTKTTAFNKINLYIHNVVSNFEGIRQLYQKIIHFEEFSKTKIQEISTYSIFELTSNSNSNSNSSGYHFLINYGLRHDKKCEFSEVIALRDRSLFYSKKHDEAQSFIETCLEFSKKIEDIKYLLDDINELYMKGFPYEFPLKIVLRKRKILVFIEQYIIPFYDIRKIIKQFLSMISEAIIQAYEQSSVMRFFSGQQFKILFNYLRKENVNDKEVLSLLQYASNFGVRDLNKSEMLFAKENMMKTFSLMFQWVNEFVKRNFEKWGIDSMLPLGGNNIIVKDHKPGIYNYLVTNCDCDVLQACLYLTGTVPLFQTILLCNEMTTKERIISFLYLSVKYPGNVPFFILKADSLDLDKRMEIAYHIEKLYSESEDNMLSSLFFAYSDKDCDLIDQLSRMKGCSHFLIPQDENAMIIRDPIIQNVQVITSDASGTGKSTYIYQQAKAHRKEYVHFPLGGVLSWGSIVSRLKLLEGSEEIYFHLDISEASNCELMMDFLFSFLVTGGVYAHDKVFLLNKSWKVFVELPYGFVDYIGQYPILTQFPNVMIFKDNMPKMIIPHDISSDIHIVANYLDALENDNLKYNEIVISCNCNAGHGMHLPTCASSLQRYPDQRIESLISTYMTLKSPTYYQICSFISILADQFRKLSNNFYFSVDQLLDMGVNKQTDLAFFRPTLVKGFIHLTNYFTEGAYKELINAQNQTYKSYIHDETEDRNQLLEVQNIFSFQQVPFNLVFFDEAGQALCIITTSDKNTREYKHLQQLWSSNSLENINLPDYYALDHQGFISEVERVLGKKVVKTDLSDYVFTMDNFIKMNLILLRVRARIPVIMMGETGCGKTFLLEMIAKIKKHRMVKLNIHAGVTDEDIITFMDTKVLKDLMPNETLWVFFDEINTCHCMGLIAEILCKNSMLGTPLPENLEFLAACNPYRKIKNPNLLDFGLTTNKLHHVRSLVYTVNPLPQSLLNYVFDFGSLSTHDENRYIEAMLSKVITNDNFRTLARCTIIECHRFFKEKNDDIIVSLRDIRKFVIFYKWFLVNIQERKLYETNAIKSLVAIPNHDDRTIFRAIVLSLFICYYIRIHFRKQRDALKSIIVDSFMKNNLSAISKEDIDRIFKEEQEDLVRHIKLPKGIAKNTALLDNLYALFVCVNTKIPIFLCGKPGCSKTLAVKLLYSSMRGLDSNDSFFKNFPRLFMNCYQGSLTSTSKGVEAVFKKARSLVNSRDLKDIISVVFIDEIGLAEISPNNPLKVIHSELEYDETSDKVAFIGISNWRLDASKINRGIFLSRPDLNEQDLIDTGIAIAKAYDEMIPANLEKLVRNIALAYYGHQSSQKGGDCDFHGSRDFYHAIKYVSKKYHGVDSHLLAMRAFERNFGGSEISVNEIKKKYIEQCREVNMNMNINSYDVRECICENIQDSESRYLMLISQSRITPYLIQLLLGNLNLRAWNFIGSQFKNDFEKEDYHYKILHKIQICMEQGKIIQLKGLEILYPSLYDLFNQTFTEYSGKNYARIAFGISNNQMACVHPDFRCIVLLDSEELSKQDPPFLNRFEKHFLSIQHLISEKLIQLSKDIMRIILSITVPFGENKFSINLSSQLMNCDEDEICGLLFKLINSNSYYPEEDLIIKCLEVIVPTFSQDIICALRISQLNIPENQKLVKEILRIYSTCHHQNLQSYFEICQRNINDNLQKSRGAVVYTFTSILNDISPKFSDPKMIKEALISRFKAEYELARFLKEFYESKSLKFLILKFRPMDCIQLNLVEYLIEDIHRDHAYPQKIVVFTVHIVRVMEYEEISQKWKKDLLSHLSDYPQIFIDNLNSDYPKCITDVIYYTVTDLFHDHDLFNFNDAFDSRLYPCLTKIEFNFNHGRESLTYIKTLMKSLKDNYQIKAWMMDSAIKHLANTYDIIARILSKKRLCSSNSDMISLIKSVLPKYFEYSLTQLIFNLERLDALEFSFEGLNTQYGTLLTEIWELLIAKEDFTMVKINENIQENKVQRVQGMRIPFMQRELEKILTQIKPFGEKLREYEDDIRYYSIEKNQFDNFTQLKENLIISVKLEIDHSDLFHIIKAKQTEVNIYDLVKDDYINYFTAIHKCESKGVMSYMIELKMKTIRNESDMAYLFLWIEGNSSLIESILHITDCLSYYHRDLLDKLKKEKMKIASSLDHDRIKKEVNGVFYILFECLLRISLQVNNIPSEQLEEYLEVLKSIFHQAFQLSYILAIDTKELYEVQTFLKILTYAQQHIDLNKLIEEMYMFKNEENMFIENSFEGLLAKQIDFYHNYLQEKEFPRFINDFLIGKMEKFNNSQSITQLISFLLSHKDNLQLIHDSKYFLEQLMLKRYQLTPQNMDEQKHKEFDYDPQRKYSEQVENYCSFACDADEILNKFQDLQNEILEEHLISIFENSIMQYFDQIKSEENSVFNLSLSYFDKSIRIVEDYWNIVIGYNQYHKHYRYPMLAFLYSVSFIKIYLYKFTQFFMRQENQHFKYNEVFSLMLHNHTPVKTIVQIYFLKCLRLHLPTYDQILIQQFDTKKNLDWLKDFNLQEFISSQDYHFISLENRNSYLALAGSYAQPKECLKEIERLISEDNLTVLVDLIVNKILVNSNCWDNNKLFIAKLKEFVLKLECSKNVKNLLCILLSKEDFESKIARKERNELIFMSYKLALVCFNLNEDNFWGALSNKGDLYSNCSSLNSSKIQGNRLSCNLKDLLIQSIAFHGYLIGKMSLESLKKLQMESENKKWEMMQNELLVTFHISDMVIFLNIFAEKLYTFGQEQDASMERRLNDVVREIITYYPESSAQYKEFNMKLRMDKSVNIRSIIHESCEISLLDQAKYPFANYFRITTYPSKEDMITQLQRIPNYKAKYPVISSYIEHFQEIKMMKNLTLMNPLVKFMIKHCSYVKSRKQAKEELIRTFWKDKNEQMLNDFLKGWQNYQEYASYASKCKEFTKPYPHDIGKSNPIAYILNDSTEDEYGIYIANAYELFITWQNRFIQDILDNMEPSGIASHYKESLMRKVVIQEALPCEIVTEESLSSLRELARTYSSRFIFKENSISYAYYTIISYDFDKIEEELARMLLPRKKMFEKHQRYVTYAYELYKGKNVNVLMTLSETIHQEPLNEEEKQVIATISREMMGHVEDVLHYLNVVAFFLHSSKLHPSTLISALFNILPFAFDFRITRFFQAISNMSISKIINILEYVEFIAYDRIILNVTEGQVQLSRDAIQELDRYFNSKADVIVTKPVLAGVVQRYIIRFLCGKLGSEINPRGNLVSELKTRHDLWAKTIYENPKHTEEMDLLMQTVSVQLDQAIAFYEWLNAASSTSRRIEEEKEEEQYHHGQRGRGRLGRGKGGRGRGLP